MAAGLNSNSGHIASVPVIAVRRIPYCPSRSRRKTPPHHSPKFKSVAIDVFPNPHIKMALENGRAAIGLGIGSSSGAPT